MSLATRVAQEFNTVRSEIAARISKVTSTDNAIPKFNGTNGDVQGSGVTIDDNNNVTTSGSFNGYGGSGFKNDIFNGGMDVWQYGTSLLPDRFKGYFPGASATYTRSTDVPSGEGFRYSFAFTGNNGVTHSTEATVSKKYKGKTAIFSAWVKSIGFVGFLIKKQSVFEGGLSGGISDITGLVAEVLQAYTDTGNWQRISIKLTFPDSTEMDNGLTLIFTSTDFKITGVQLEEGSIVTPFEQRPYGMELALCKRYAKDMYAIAIRPFLVTANVIYFKFEINLREATTSGLSGVEGTDWSINSLSGTAQTGFTLAISNNLNGTVLVTATKTSHGLSDCNIEFLTANKNILSAEL